MKGPSYLERLGVTTNSPKPAETKGVDYGKKARDAKEEFEFRQTVENLNNPPSLREMQEKRLSEEREEKNRAADRAQKLEEDRIARIEAEADAAAEEVQRERERREKAEADLRAQRDQLILDELKRLQTSQISPQQKLEEYFTFQAELEKRFGKTKEPPAPNSGLDPHLALEIEKMKLDLEKWKIEREETKEERRFQREDKKEERQIQKEIEMSKVSEAARNREFLGSGIKMLGDTIAQGLLAHADNIPTGVSAPASRVASSAPPQKMAVNIKAAVGEAGEIDCPSCQSKVGVAPTALNTVCAKCGQQFTIERIAVEVHKDPVTQQYTSVETEEDDRR